MSSVVGRETMSPSLQGDKLGVEDRPKGVVKYVQSRKRVFILYPCSRTVNVHVNVNNIL